MVNATVMKFGYPDTLLREYDHWVVLLRPEQVTAGCLILANKSEAGALSTIGANAFLELDRVLQELEGVLRLRFSFEKINYLLLMMVDPHVHFHVIPRYSSTRNVQGCEIADQSWPKPPDLSKAAPLSADQFRGLCEELRSLWPR